MKNVTQNTFDQEVVTPSMATPVVVLFHAEWCGPCKTLKPIIERLSQELSFPLVGVDGGVEKSLAQAENVRGVPTLMVYSQGKRLPVSIVGGKTEKAIKDFLHATGVTQNKLNFE